jgi:hypothetical protein
MMLFMIRVCVRKSSSTSLIRIEHGLAIDYHLCWWFLWWRHTAPTMTSKEQCFATVEMLSQLPIRGYAGICVSPDGKIYDKDNMQDAR